MVHRLRLQAQGAVSSARGRQRVLEAAACEERSQLEGLREEVKAAQRARAEALAELAEVQKDLRRVTGELDAAHQVSLGLPRARARRSLRSGARSCVRPRG